jgi:glycosyltransferase involved in cell wall biosynthesis
MPPVLILHLMNGFANASIGNIVKRLIKGMEDQEYGWAIGGLSYQGELHDDYRGMGAEVVDFSNGGRSSESSIQQVRRYLQDNPVQIIHTHTIRSLLTAWSAMIGMQSSNKHRLVHLSTKHTLTALSDRRWGAIYSLIDHSSLYLPDYLIAVSQQMEQRIRSQPGIRPKRVILIQNAIPYQEWYAPEKRTKFRRQMGIDPEVILIGFGGRFEPVKRLDLLIESFAEVHRLRPETRLVLAGEGSLRPKLESQTRQLDLTESVIWPGFVQDMPGFLSALDIYVQTSVNEGLSLSILEAMAARKPVVATAVGGNVEIITDHVDGLLIPPLSTTEITKALLTLIQSPKLGSQFASAATYKLQTKYSLELMVERYQHLYEGVI